MLQINSNGNVVYIVAEGKLNDEDYDELFPMLRKKIEEYGKVSWYFQMKNFKGWSFNAFWRDIQFDIKNDSKLDKIAIVGENKWQKVMTDFMKPFSHAKIKYFDDDKVEEAKRWVDS